MRCLLPLAGALLLTACQPKPRPAAATPPASPSPAGTYQALPGTNQEQDCALVLKIIANQHIYSYVLTTTARQAHGTATVTRDESGEQTLTLEGLEWDEYLGDISQEESGAQPKPLAVPTSLGCRLQGDSITIQNYGNSLNYYTKLQECGDKYLTLVKQ